MPFKRKAETGMQYILKQTLLRRNQLLRRARRTQKKELKDEFHQLRANQLMSARWTRKAIKTERTHRREDWLCGPLAPQRDIGEDRDIYGTARQEIMQPHDLPKRLQPKGEQVGIVASDRVVVVRGLGRGQIGEVTEVKNDSATCYVQGIREADFPIPPWTPQAAESPTKYQAQSLPIPLKDVRLVYPLTDTETNLTRDVVIRHMYFGAPYTERSPFSNLPRHTRYIRLSADPFVEPSPEAEESDAFIPLDWPAEKLIEQAATEADTTRITVDHETYIPTPELHKVFPASSIIAELRDPYARHRVSHDLDFMKRKVLVDMKAAWERARLKRAGMAVGGKESEKFAQKMERGEQRRMQRMKEGMSSQTRDIILEEQALTLGQRAIVY
jgi:large subunit ribosomal protein L24